MADAGYEVVGVNIYQERVNTLHSGHSYVGHMTDEVVQRAKV